MKTIETLVKKLQENCNGTLQGGFGGIKGGVKLMMKPTNYGGCLNSGNCSGSTNSGGLISCSNTGNCTGATNIGSCGW